VPDRVVSTTICDQDGKFIVVSQCDEQFLLLYGRIRLLLPTYWPYAATFRPHEIYTVPTKHLKIVGDYFLKFDRGLNSQGAHFNNGHLSSLSRVSHPTFSLP
jgi:hypothetical protein